jgi:hypothetical protein
MKSHWDTLCACDFFSVEALGPFGTVRHNDNGADGKVACRSRLGGLLNYYHRKAA